MVRLVKGPLITVVSNAVYCFQCFFIAFNSLAEGSRHTRLAGGAERARLLSQQSKSKWCGIGDLLSSILFVVFDWLFFQRLA